MQFFYTNIGTLKITLCQVLGCSSVPVVRPFYPKCLEYKGEVWEFFLRIFRLFLSYAGKVIYSLLLEVHKTRISSRKGCLFGHYRESLQLNIRKWHCTITPGYILDWQKNGLKMGSEVCDVQDFNIFSQMMKVNETMLHG